jgi:hypothetical protein
MDAYEAVIRRAGAARLGVLGDESYSIQQQVASAGGGGFSVPVYIYGAGPAKTKEFFVPVAKPGLCVCQSGLISDKVAAPVLNWPTEAKDQLYGKALNDARIVAAAVFRKACAEWQAKHCFDPAILEMQRRLRAQNEAERKKQASTWSLTTPLAQSYMPRATVAVAAARPAFTASGFRMNATPMDFTSWMTAQRGRA